VLAADQQRVEAFYLAGIAHAELGSSDMAVRSMQRALRLDPQDELIRLSAESLLLDRYGIDSRLRRQFAEFHRLRGEDLVEMNQIPHAAVAFRRALRLYPFLPDARRQLAELYRIQGFRSRYLQELEVLSELGEVDQEVRDRIEVYRSILSESVAADWGVEQFEIGRDRYRLALFARESPIGNRLPGIATAVGRYLRFLLLGYENVEVAETIRTVDRDSDAFAAARELDADYYAILRLQRGDRAFGLTADVYVGRTGTLLRQFQSVTAGNHMVENAAYRVSRDMRDALPFRATLLERDGNLGLISAGAVDGIEAGDTYAVLAESAVLLAPREFRLEYPEHEILGDFVVTRVDDLVSEGEIKRGGLFDMVNAGDLVVVAPDEEEEEATLSPTVLYPPLYNRVRRLRN
jgi:tetratricopeptide (TPR) repeat protein